MWQFYYLQARQLAEDRKAEAARERLARQAARQPAPSRSRLEGLRRGGAIFAASIARRLDECVAREELLGTDERVGAVS